MILHFSQQIFEKYLYIKFDKITSSGSRVFPCGLTADGQTDMTELIVALRNFANAPKNSLTFDEYSIIKDSGQQKIISNSNNYESVKVSHIECKHYLFFKTSR